METDAFFRQYTSHDEILKYTKATAGLGISYLLDHDYKAVYLEALAVLPQEIRERGIRMLEFGCGGGMNLLHLISVLHQEGIKVESAIGTDFSPVMIETARREAKNYLSERDLHRLEFHVAKNETLISNLSASAGTDEAKLEKSFDFILGVNTIRYCHDAKTEMDNARDIFDLLVPGGVCVVIDMNNRFPVFRSDLKNGLRWKKEKQCYVPSLEEVHCAICGSRLRDIAKRALLLGSALSGRINVRAFKKLVTSAEQSCQVPGDEVVGRIEKAPVTGDHR